MRRSSWPIGAFAVLLECQRTASSVPKAPGMSACSWKRPGRGFRSSVVSSSSIIGLRGTSRPGWQPLGPCSLSCWRSFIPSILTQIGGRSALLSSLCKLAPLVTNKCSSRSRFGNQSSSQVSVLRSLPKGLGLPLHRRGMWSRVQRCMLNTSLPHHAKHGFIRQVIHSQRQEEKRSRFTNGRND
jgi:hypothetical protein